jgi:Suppressor of fused protein (SUFU)
MSGASERAIAFEKTLGNSVHQAFPDDDGAVPAVEVRRYTAKVVSSAPECDIWVSSGMSDVAMLDARGNPLRRELIFYAPPGGDYVAGLRALGRFPHDEKTYLDHGHTVQVFGSFFIPGGAEALANRGVEAITLPHVFLAMTPILRHQRLSEDLVIDGSATEFLWVVPISAGELELKKSQGADALLELFETQDHSWLFDPSRASYLP